MTIFDDDRLELVLADLAAHVDVEGAAADSTRRRRPLQLWAAGAAALIALAIVVVAPARQAVGRWLGIGTTEVRIDPSTSVPSDAMGIEAGVPRIKRADAEDLVGELGWLERSSLGDPGGYALIPEGGVLVAWKDGTTLWIHTSDIDAALLLKKLTGSNESVRFVENLGDSALAITGDHVLVTPHRTVAATTVVLWQIGDREFRLESDRDVDELIRIAQQLVPSE